MKQATLPIDDLLQEIAASLHRHCNLVIEAAPGAGKTTRVPPALLGLVSGEVLVLEPRRIAARLAARRVASEMDEQVGETVGYQVRFEEVSGPRTRLRFMTEGVLTRRMLSDPELKGVDAVVLDEFHERHLDSDLALALLKRLQRRRPDLKLLVMSATLDAAPVANFLGGCPLVRSAGRAFELSIEHLPYSPDPLPVQVRKAVELLGRDHHTGHVLVFLQGAAEIRKTARECEGVARREDLLVLPMHGDLTPADQDRAVGPTVQRKLILATNVAESSVTIEGVTAVIDSGLARFATYSPWTGLPTLHLGRVSRASAKQRAGRAGRTGPGRVLRLYPEEDYLRRPEYDTPEVLRSDLAGMCLALRAMRIDRVEDVEWLDRPPESAVEQAETLLDRLGITEATAQKLARYPIAPRLSCILTEAMARGVGEDGCAAAALLGSGSRFEANDLLTAMDLPPDANTLRQTEQLRRIARPPKQTGHDDQALLLSVLSGFPDRVARRRAGSQVTLSSGLSAELAGDPPLYEFMVAVDAEDRKERPLPLIGMTSKIEPEWLVDLFPYRVRERVSVTWNDTGERVEAVSALLYDELVIEESRDAAPDPEAAADLLFQKALDVGVARFVEVQAFESLLARIEFAGFGQPDIPGFLRELCSGRRSFAELKIASKDALLLLEQRTNPRELRELAPVNIRLQGGRQVKVHYERGKLPWIASRLQDFFGMKDTPRIGPEGTPVVLYLLAPNQRAVQTTTDLAGFWERLYPQVRRELMRRYPRHAWPEKP